MFGEAKNCEDHQAVSFSPLSPRRSSGQTSSLALYSRTLSLCSSLSVKDHVSHPYKETGKIVVLDILILMFLESKLEDKKFPDRMAVGIH